MRKRAYNNSLKPIIGLVTFFFVLLFIIGILHYFAKRSDFFRIKDVLISSASGRGINLSYLKGRNILTIDLQKEEQRISQWYPDYMQIRLVRILPDRMFAYCIKRKPVAYVKLNRYFYVDQNAALFDADTMEEPSDVPIISGLDMRINLKLGKKYKELYGAVDIIKEIKNNKALKDSRIKMIDVSDAENISFIIIPFSITAVNTKAQSPFDNSLQIRIGKEFIKDKINILSSLLAQAKNDWENINYIDLRFKDPVIKFKDVK